MKYILFAVHIRSSISHCYYAFGSVDLKKGFYPQARNRSNNRARIKYVSVTGYRPQPNALLAKVHAKSLQNASEDNRYKTQIVNLFQPAFFGIFGSPSGSVAVYSSRKSCSMRLIFDFIHIQEIPRLNVLYSPLKHHVQPASRSYYVNYGECVHLRCATISQLTWLSRKIFFDRCK